MSLFFALPDSAPSQLHAFVEWVFNMYMLQHDVEMFSTQKNLLFKIPNCL